MTKQDLLQFERRYYTHDVRAAQEESRIIEGYASTVEVYYDMGWYLEIIDRKAFDNAFMDDCACLDNHQDHQVLGRVRNKTLSLSADQKGLFYSCDVAPTTAGNDMLALVKRGDIYQSSFGFSVRVAVWEEVSREALKGLIDDAVLDKVSYGGIVDVRRIKEVKTLWDVSPVTFPANPDTSVAKRSWEQFKKDVRSAGGALKWTDKDLRLMAMKMAMG